MLLRDLYEDKIIQRVTSAKLFSYLVPKVYGIRPGFGPKSGGTEIMVFGENLDIGLNQTVDLLHTSCQILQNTGGNITCITKQYSGAMNKVPVTVRLDGNPLKPFAKDKSLYGFFQYRADPIITSVKLTKTIFSGRTNITVEGRYLNSVARPLLVVTFTHKGERKKLRETCFNSNDSWGYSFTCPTPSLAQNTYGLRVTADKPFRTTVTFIMDGIPQERLFEEKPAPHIYLYYYPDPTFFPFKETLIEKDISPEIVVQGKNLNITLKPGDVKITAEEKEFCVVTKMTLDKLHCRVNKDVFVKLSKRDTRDTRIYSIKANVGSHSYSLGNILSSKANQETEGEATKKNSELSVGAIITVVVSVLVSAVFFTVVLLYYVMRKVRGRRRKKYHREKAHLDLDLMNTGEEKEILYQNILTSNSMTNSHIVELLVLEQIYLQREQLHVDKQIGSGQFGCVMKGTLVLPETKDPVPVAVKTIKGNCLRAWEEAENLLKEGLMMKDFHHINVLSLLGVCFENNGIPMVVLPFMENGDLHSYLLKEEVEITIAELVDFALQIAEGMEYLSTQKFVHRDLAARNCTLDKTMVVKVADFGLSRDVYERAYYKRTSSKALPVRWMAPESITSALYTEKSDVWSFGVVLWEMFTRGELPYSHMQNQEVLKRVPGGLKLERPGSCPMCMFKIMMSCWNESRKRRPRFQDLVKEIKEIIAGWGAR